MRRKALALPHGNEVEVDMVPLIDIISLLLMFLIIVGGSACQAEAIQMKLPRADQALNENDVVTEGRLTVQMQETGGRWFAVMSNKRYELLPHGGNETLGKQKRLATRDKGELSIPVKLRVPEAAPMREVERLVMTLAHVGLSRVQYAAEK